MDESNQISNKKIKVVHHSRSLMPYCKKMFNRSKQLEMNAWSLSLGVICC
jgi:hypothetical protein